MRGEASCRWQDHEEEGVLLGYEGSSHSGHDCFAAGKAIWPAGPADQLISRAARVWLRWCRSMGYEADQPCQYRSEVRGRTVILKNVRGELARYTVGDDGRLRRKS